MSLKSESMLLLSQSIIWWRFPFIVIFAAFTTLYNNFIMPHFEQVPDGTNSQPPSSGGGGGSSPDGTNSQPPSSGGGGGPSGPDSHQQANGGGGGGSDPDSQAQQMPGWMMMMNHELDLQQAFAKQTVVLERAVARIATLETQLADEIAANRAMMTFIMGRQQSLKADVDANVLQLEGAMGTDPRQ